jgi:hypothetical protein
MLLSRSRMSALVMNRLFAIGSSMNKSAIGILATASTVVRVLDASSANTRRLAVVTTTSQLSILNKLNDS